MKLLTRITLFLVATLPTLFAQGFSTHPWTGDGSVPETSSSVVWAYSLGSSATATINGVSFTGIEGGNPAASGRFSLNVPNPLNNDSNVLTAQGGSGSAVMAANFVWGQPNAVLTLEGLTIGQDYSLNLYTVGWEAPGQRLSNWTSGTDAATLDVNAYGDNNGTRINYSFTANAATRTIQINAISGNTWHFYGLALSSSPESVVIYDDFADGNLGTNSGGTGSGFTSFGQFAVTESGGFLNLDTNPSGAVTLVAQSTTALQPFGANPTKLQVRYGTVNRDSTGQRIVFGYKLATSTGDHFTPGVQGIYVGIVWLDGTTFNTNPSGFLQVTDDQGGSTTLATWTWGSDTSLSNLQADLTTDSTSYSLSFAGASPIVSSGSLTGSLSALGTVGSSTFAPGFHNQYWGTSAQGGCKVDWIRASSPIPPAAVSVTGTFAGLTAVYGSPSSPASVSVSGTNLQSNLLLTAPAGFEISSSESAGYGASISLTPVNGALSSTAVYLRLTASTGAGDHSGNVVITGSSLNPVSLSAAGSITRRTLTLSNATVISKLYNGTPDADITGTLQTVVNGDQVTVTGGGTFASAEAGTAIPVTAALSLQGPDAGNYTLEQPQGLTGTILTGEISFSSTVFNAGQDDASVSLTLVREAGLPATTVTIQTVDGTANVQPPFEAAVAGTDYIDLDGTPAATASFAEGASTATIVLQLIPRSGDTVANRRFSATIVGTTGGKVGDSNTATVRILSNDANAPNLIVTSPAEGVASVIDVWPSTVQGSVSDDRGLESLTLSLNGGPQTEIPLTAAGSTNHFSWSMPMEPQDGENQLAVTARDLRGNVATVTRTFVFARAYQLTVTRTAPQGTEADALGIVAIAATPSGNAVQAGNPLEAKIVPGTTVRLTAPLVKGYAFLRWLNSPDGAVALANTLEFTMPAADLSVGAEFVTNEIFSGPAGSGNTFRGLLLPADGTPASNATVGFLQLTLDADYGSMTGLLYHDGLVQKFRGFVLGDGAVYFSGLTPQSSLTFGESWTLTLSYNWAEGKDSITATLTQSALQSVGVTRREIYSSTNLVPAALLNSAAKADGPISRGLYNVAFPANPHQAGILSSDFPQGDGYLSLTLTDVGDVTGSGLLADGSVITVSSALHAGNQCPIFAQISTPGRSSAERGGSFLGTLVFDTAQEDTDVSGASFRWFRPDVTALTPLDTAAARAAADLYTVGWPQGITVDAIGSLYDKGKTIQQGIDLDGPNTDVNGETLGYEDGKLVFYEGKLTSPISKQNFIVAGSQVIKLPATDSSYTLAPVVTNGTFSGSFRPNWTPLAPANPTYRGVLLQKGRLKGGYGFFISNGSANPEAGDVDFSLERFVEAQSPVASNVPPSVSAAAPYTISGNAGDLRGVARVEVTLNGGEPVLAVLGAPSSTGSVPYQLAIEPALGDNTIVVTVVDLRGNRSSHTRTFNFFQRFPLAISRSAPSGVTVDAAGSVTLAANPSSQASSPSSASTNANPRNFDVQHGTALTLSAQPRPGFAFVKWTGLPSGAKVLGNVASFVMPTSAVSVTAEFQSAQSLFTVAGAGSDFFGLLLPRSGTPTKNSTVAMISGNLNATTGVFTGTLLVDGVSQPVSCTFFGDGSALFTVKGVRETSLAFGNRILTLSYAADERDAISATLTNGGETSSGVAKRAIYSATNRVPAAYLNSSRVPRGPVDTGFFTVAFPAKAQDPVRDSKSYPQGDGYATITLTNAGAVSGTGVLADGTAFTFASGLIAGNQCPIFAQLTTPGQAATVRGGAFLGTLVFDANLADTDVAATDLLWIRPDVTGLPAGNTAAAIAAADLYTPGWPAGIKVDAIGALYDRSKSLMAGLDRDGSSTDVNGAPLNYEDGKLVFSAGKLSAAITKSNFIITAANAVTKIPTTDTTFTLGGSLSTGTFSGTFLPNWSALAGSNPGFKGILLQKGVHKGGHGFFLSNAASDKDPESGDVNFTLEPLIGAVTPLTSDTTATIRSTAPYTITGRAGNARGVARVEVVLNEGDPVNATLDAADASGSVTFSLATQPLTGSNTMVITVVDLRGNRSSTTVDFVFDTMFPLTVNRSVPAGVNPDNAGTVTMAANPSAQATALSPTTANANPRTANVQHGTNLTMTATPKSGYTFLRWTGLPAGASTSGFEARFAMPVSALSVTAEFVRASTIFAGATGSGNSFHGLIRPQVGTSLSNATAGFLDGTIDPNSGAFSGRIFIDGTTQPISALFVGNGTATFLVNSTRQSSFVFGGRTVTLSLNVGQGKDEILATLTTAAGVSSGVAKRAIYSGSNPVPSTLVSPGRSSALATVVFPSKPQNPAIQASAYPQGDGFASATISTIGTVTISGILADNSTFTGTSALVKDNELMFMAQIDTPGTAASRGGSFSGSLRVDLTQVNTDLTGTDLLWIRPTVSQQTGTTAAAQATQAYTNGWPGGIRVDAVGALYSESKTVETSLGLSMISTSTGNAKLRFEDGKLTATITKTNLNISGNSVRKLPSTDSSFTLTVVPTTGSFTGTIRPNWTPAATTLPSFKGIILQKGTNRGGYGFFLSNIPSDLDPQSGGVSLTKP